MVAVEFNQPGTHQPDAEFTKKVQTKALESGLILLTCGVYGNVLRFLFPSPSKTKSSPKRWPSWKPR
jgi:4-aminobutyrate aminotransferase